jgi:DNA polymerase III subunit delta'
VAISLDLEEYDRRRSAMFALVRAAAGAAPFSEWMKYSESIARGKSEKLESYLKVLYMLLRDLMVLNAAGGAIRNGDIRPQLEPLARKVSFAWIRAAVKKVDELAELLRRNIQKTIALDALILELRRM